MNRFRQVLHFSAHLGRVASVLIATVLLLLLAPGMPKLTGAMSSEAQTAPTAVPAATVIPSPTIDIITTAVPTLVLDSDALTATATIASAQTAEALVTATATAVSARATLTAVAERSTKAVLSDRSTQTAAANAMGTVEAQRATATVEQQSTATAAASLTAVAESKRVYEATTTAAAATVMVSPTAVPSPQPEPSATPDLAPAPSTPPVPEGPTEPDGDGLPMLLVVGAIVGALAAVAATAFFVVSRRRKQTPPSPAQPTLQPPSVGEQALDSLLTPHRPEPGIPYLESRNRPAGVLYCPLKKPTLRVGRSAENDLVIDDSFAGWQTVSRHHATVEYDDDRVVVVADETPNGVSVQGKRTGANVVRDGWIVSFGQVEFVLRENRKGGVQ